MIKLFRYKSVKDIATKSLNAAMMQHFKAMSAIEESEAAVEKLTKRIQRLSKYKESTDISSLLSKKIKEELYESEIALLEAQEGVEYAKSEVGYQASRMARLSLLLKDINNEKDNGTNSRGPN